MNNGFIQLHRQLLEWEWYTDQKTFKLFLHCLLKANHKEQNWRGQTIKRGQFITSLQHLSNETGLSVKQVRTALSNLIKTGELGKQSTSINTLITVTCYDKYQVKGKPKANGGQTEGKQRATNNNDNKENNENKSFKSERDFLDWFNKGCEVLRGKRGRFKVLDKTSSNNLKKLNTCYSRDEFKHALKMMHKEGWADQTNNFHPEHFLRNRNFNKFLNLHEVDFMTVEEKYNHELKKALGHDTK